MILALQFYLCAGVVYALLCGDWERGFYLKALPVRAVWLKTLLGTLCVFASLTLLWPLYWILRRAQKAGRRY